MPEVVASPHGLKDRERVDLVGDLQCSVCFPDLSETQRTCGVHDFVLATMPTDAAHVCRQFDPRGRISDAASLGIVNGGIPLNLESSLEASVNRGVQLLKQRKGMPANFENSDPCPSHVPDMGSVATSSTAVFQPTNEHHNSISATPTPITSMALLHSPPYDTCLDRIATGHVGSVAVRGFLEESYCACLIDFAVCGHIHETVRVSRGKFVEVVSGSSEETTDLERSSVIWEATGEHGYVRMDTGETVDGERLKPVLCMSAGNEYKREHGKALQIIVERWNSGRRRMIIKRIPI
ncbi:hypothetical protein HDU93_005618 [Gonapodya sp. JEL0774]|nr:hypothetical protein HDU93_005618 [Gonapodya sp. JEL0774]